MDCIVLEENLIAAISEVGWVLIQLNPYELKAPKTLSNLQVELVGGGAGRRVVKSVEGEASQLPLSSLPVISHKLPPSLLLRVAPEGSPRVKEEYGHPDPLGLRAV